MYVDTHAHLFFDNFESDLKEVIERAVDNGIKKIIIPGTDIATSKQAIKIAEEFDPVFATVGTHPHDTKNWHDDLIIEQESLSIHPKVVAIGEIGLDYYYDYSPKEKQIEAFREQLDLAVKLSLPVVIHNRDANEDTMNIIREYSQDILKAQFHCFAGSLDDALELVELGHLISFTGNVTFKKMEDLRVILKNIPLKSLMLETDCPFMTPVPHRGKRNVPSYVVITAAKIAELHNTSVEKVAEITTKNAELFFGI